MNSTPANLTLIGMPGSGKSTVGKKLAKLLGWNFLDLDRQIEDRQGMKLWQINEAGGHDLLKSVEQQVALEVDCRQTVIAPGGSIVYSEPAMSRLRELGQIVFLDVPLGILAVRIGDIKARGVIIRQDMDLGDLLEERRPLLQKWATHTISCGKQSPKKVALQIVDQLNLQAVATEESHNPDAAT